MGSGIPALSRHWKRSWKAVVLLLLFAATFPAGAATDRYRLTWRADPATTMVVGWSQLRGVDPVVCYGAEDLGNDWEAYSFQKTPDRTTSKAGMDNRFARLYGLQISRSPAADGQSLPKGVPLGMHLCNWVVSSSHQAKQRHENHTHDSRQSTLAERLRRRTHPCANGLRDDSSGHRCSQNR